MPGVRACTPSRQVLRAPHEPAPDPDPSPRVRPKRRTDVIDLGGPLRARRPYTPNPRLYPGPQVRAGARPRRRHPPAARSAPLSSPRHRPARRPTRRTLPNARLYRPPPPRARPPPARAPRAAWSPPVPPRALDTASHAALRLAARRDSAPATTQQRPRSPSLPPPPPAWSRLLVVKLPAAGDAGARSSRPAPAGSPRLRSLDTDSSSTTPRPASPHAGMAAPPRHSASPEDRSDGNDPLSAPSEYLAEFLSAIMQRQYAEALKYCRLILQYEPQNATARGFYPLLRQKLGLARGRSSRAPPRGSDSEDTSRHSAAPPRDEEVMSHSADESGSEGSCASQSSLSLDSSSRSGAGSGRTAASGSHSASGGSWSSARWPASDTASDEPDDNGNAPAPPAVTLTPRAPRPDDVENDNAGGGGGDHTTRLKSETAASLRRLRAQFACEIK